MAEIKVSLSDFVKWTPRQEVAWLSMLENKFTLFGGARFGGKALSLDTPIPTPDGYVPIVDLKEGDKVFGSDGNICNVLWRSDIETYKSYDVYFSDGSVLRASSEHQWVTQTIGGTKEGTRTTQDIKDSLLYDSKPNHSVVNKGAVTTDYYSVEAQSRFIVDVREVEPEAMCCISVDSPDHTYLAGETFIPTHNSYWLRNSLISWLILQGMRGHKHVQVGLFCKTYSELEDRHIPKFMQMPDWLGTFSDSQVYGLSFRLSERYGGGIIMLRNLDKGADRYKSAEFAAIGIDELTEFEADQFLILIGSLRWVGIDHHPFIAGSNPDGIGNDWVKACFIDKDYSNQQLAGLKGMADQFNFVRSLATDNPYLPKEYYQILDAQPPARRRAWRDGDWNVIQGAAFPEFSTDTHVMPLNKIPDLNFESYIPYTFPRYQGIDWGIARPFVCLFGAINPANGRLIVYDEISQAGLTDSQQAEAIKMRSDENEMKARRFADPKMWNKQSVNDKLMSTADVYQSHGIKIYPGDPNRHAKKARVHELLSIRPDGYPGLVITPECKQLIKQLQKLMTAKDDPEDVNDHQEDDSYDAFGMLTNPVGKYNKPYKRVRPNANNKSPFQALERI